MVIALTGSASLAGLTVALFGISRFLVSYPVGKITDTYGRKPGIQLGLGLALVGTVAVGISMLLHSVAGFTLGMLLFGMGFNAAQQLRVAAADMFPPRLRAQALGFVATGSMVGLAFGPVLMWLSEIVAGRTGLEAIALPWLMVPTLILLGMVLVTFVRPDPKEIGMNLEHYYPDYKPPRTAPGRCGLVAGFSALSLFRFRPTRLAIISNCAGQGNMSIVMVLTSLVLAHHGHSLTAIAFSHMFHSAGMFAFTIPLGRLADRHGREMVMYPGCGRHADRCDPRHLHRRLLDGHARHLPGRAGLGGGQCRLHRADRRPRRDRAPRPRHRRQRQRRGRDDGAGGGGNRTAGRMHEPAGCRRRRGGGRRRAARSAGNDVHSPASADLTPKPGITASSSRSPRSPAARCAAVRG